MADSDDLATGMANAQHACCFQPPESLTEKIIRMDAKLKEQKTVFSAGSPEITHTRTGDAVVTT